MDKEISKDKKEKKKVSIKEIFRKVIFFISLCVFLVSGSQLFAIVRDYKQNADYYKDLQKYEIGRASCRERV